MIIKELTSRLRPYQTFGRITTSCPTSYSFPSEHTAIFVLSFLILSSIFPRFRYIYYTLAILVGLSRVILGCHFAGDVFVGFLIGILGYYIYRFIISKFNL